MPDNEPYGNAALECCDLVPGLHMAMPTQEAAVVILAELRRLRVENSLLRSALRAAGARDETIEMVVSGETQGIDFA